MGRIIALFARVGVPERVRRPLGYLALAVAAIALVWLLWTIWLARHDAAVIATDRQAGTIAVQNQQIATERAAGAAKDNRDAEFRNQQHQLEEATDAPITDDNRTSLDALGERMRSRAAPAR